MDSMHRSLIIIVASGRRRLSFGINLYCWRGRRDYKQWRTHSSTISYIRYSFPFTYRHRCDMLTRHMQLILCSNWRITFMSHQFTIWYDGIGCDVLFVVLCWWLSFWMLCRFNYTLVCNTLYAWKLPLWTSTLTQSLVQSNPTQFCELCARVCVCV